MPDTIPGLLLAAAGRDPDKVWLRGGAGTAGAGDGAGEPLTFAQAVARVAGTVRRLADAGVRPGDLVLVTIRTTPTYLVAWLALTAMGAVAVTTDPELAPAELAALVGQVRPRLILTDDALRGQVAAAVADVVRYRAAPSRNMAVRMMRVGRSHTVTTPTSAIPAAPS